MKKFIALLLFLFTVNIYALDPCYIGSGFAPARSGEGINFNTPGTLTVSYTQNSRAISDDTEGITLYATQLTSFDSFKSETGKAWEWGAFSGDTEVTPIELDRKYHRSIFYQGDQICTIN